MRIPPPRYLLAASVLLSVAFPLHAGTLLPPGGNVSPLQGETVPANINTYLIAETDNSFYFAPGAQTPFLSGDVAEAVVSDAAFGLSCPTCLDFAFQINVDDSSFFSVYQAILTNFAGFTFNVGYGTGTGDVVPDGMGRGPAGGGIGVSFGNDAAPTLGSGESSVFFLIATNATNYDSSGTVNIYGSNGGSCTPFDVNHCRGGQVTGSFFEPTSAPEPSSALLLGLGLAGIAALRKRFA